MMWPRSCGWAISISTQVNPRAPGRNSRKRCHCSPTRCRPGLQLAPDHAAFRHRLGTALYMMGDARSAKEQFEQVVRESPDYFLAQYSLGVLLQSGGRHAEAAEHFSAALRSRANYTEA